MITSATPLRSRGYELDLAPASFGELRRSDEARDDPAALRQRLAEDGYLYLPGFFERDAVLEVRDDLLRRLREAGALEPACHDHEAVASAEPASVSRRHIFEGNTRLPGLVFSARLLDFYAALLGGPVRHYDHIWTRLIRPGLGTQPHCDLPYMGRGTRQVMTAWIPYRDTSLELGGLILLEKSHLQAGRIRAYLDSDADVFCVNRGAYKRQNSSLSKNPASLREKFGGRWLTTGFRAGDLLTFGMELIHASLDNQTSSYRLSTDTRYQLASEPIDERWVGPATEEWAEKNRLGQIC